MFLLGLVPRGPSCLGGGALWPHLMSPLFIGLVFPILGAGNRPRPGGRITAIYPGGTVGGPGALGLSAMAASVSHVAPISSPLSSLTCNSLFAGRGAVHGPAAIDPSVSTVPMLPGRDLSEVQSFTWSSSWSLGSWVGGSAHLPLPSCGPVSSQSALLVTSRSSSGR